MTTYKIKFNLEGGNSLELDLSKEQFEKMSDFCNKELPNKNWKTESLKTIEA
jgi:hypothetical protein